MAARAASGKNDGRSCDAARARSWDRRASREPDLRPLPRDGQREAHGQRHGEQRRAAIGDEGQGHALGGQQGHSHAHIDEGLHGRDHRKARARKLRRKDRAHGGSAQQQPHREQRRTRAAITAAKQETELLARHREDEVGMGIGNAVFDRARARTDTGKTAMGESLERQARLIAGVGFD